MRHDSALPVPGQCFDDDAEVEISRGYVKYRRSPHGIERLVDNVAVTPVEIPQYLRISANHVRGATLGKLQGKQLFVAVPDAAGAVEHGRAREFDHLQQVGRVKIFHVKGRVLAHEHQVQVRHRA